MVREITLGERAIFLETVADEILTLADDLIERPMAGTGLPRGRLGGQQERTCDQLRLFAAVVRDGGFLDAHMAE